MSSEENLLSFSRRLIRTPYRYHAINVELAAFSELRGNSRLIRLQQGLLREIADRYRGQSFTMDNGDLFLLMRSDHLADISALRDEILKSILRDPQVPEDQLRRLVHVFEIPEQYAAFRERTNAYVEPAKSTRVVVQSPAQALEPDVLLEGPMNATILGHVERKIAECEIRPFLKKQDIFVYRDSAGWWPVFEERFVSLVDLQRQLFPKVEIRPSDPLFSQLCRALDERLLQYLLSNRAKITHKISVNISLETIFDQLFDIFAANIELRERENIIFEIPRIEIFHDVTLAVAAIKKLKQFKFDVAVDGMTLDLLPYVNISRFKTELIKIHLLRDHVRLLRDDECVKALRQLPLERVIFSRCDHDGAITVGRAMGITMYQGWLIDEQAAMAHAVGNS